MIDPVSALVTLAILAAVALGFWVGGKVVGAREYQRGGQEMQVQMLIADKREQQARAIFMPVPYQLPAPPPPRDADGRFRKVTP